MTANKSYLKQRLEQYGITDKHNHTSVFTGISNPQGVQFDIVAHQWFSDDNGDIKILFKTLENRHQIAHVEGRKTTAKMFRKCLSPEHRKQEFERTGEENKYSQRKGTGSLIFHTQGVIDAYLTDGLEVDTLYIVEGEFKAFVAWMHSTMWDITDRMRKDEPNLPPDSGLPIMGMTGIHNLFDSEVGGIHKDILDFCRKKRVKNIALIFDADLKSISSKYNPEKHNGKDLAQRLNSFYKAALNFRTSIHGHVDDTFLVSIKEDYMTETIPGTSESVKGLDDLFAANKGDEKEILKHLAKCFRKNNKNAYFDYYHLTGSIASQIRSYFLLNMRKGGPLDFYNKHAEILQNNEFVFLRSRYKANEEGDLKMTTHGDSDQYMRVTGKYFKKIIQYTAYGNEIRYTVPYPKPEIKQDYVDKGYRNFLDTIPKYDGFVVVPEHNPKKYRQVIGNCYNLYYKIDTEPIKGKWKTIEKFLKHLFATDENQYDVILDWLYLCWTKPTQKLPAICLYSREKKTGKSKFLDFLCELFQENATIIGNDDLVDNFNDDYITKNIIGLNEGLIDKKHTTEKIKSWITERTAQMRTKNVSRVKVDFFAKLCFTTNNEDFIRIDDDEARFWVRHVRPFEGPENPLILEEMVEEIPAFIYYLTQVHQLKYKYKTRLYFAEEVYETSITKIVKQGSKSSQYKSIHISISEKFYQYNANPNQLVKFTRLYYTISELCDFVNGKMNAEKQYIEKTLIREFNMEKPTGVLSRSKPKSQGDHNGDELVTYTMSNKKPGRFWEFKIEDFLTQEEYESLGISKKMLGIELKVSSVDKPIDMSSTDILPEDKLNF